MYFLGKAEIMKLYCLCGFARDDAHLADCDASYKDVKQKKVMVANGMVPRFISMKEKRI